MTATRSKWIITLLAGGLGVGLAEQAQTPPSPAPPTPTPAPPSPPQGGQQPQDGSREVKGDFVTMLTMVLNLTADQQTKVKAIFEDSRAKAKVIADSTTLSGDEKKAKIQELREATNAQIKPLLTPDQQKNFDEVLKQLKERADRTYNPSPAPR